MDRISPNTPTDPFGNQPARDYKARANSLVLQSTLGTLADQDASQSSVGGLNNALALTAEQILERINGAISTGRPELQAGLPSQEGLTPESTSSWVVRGITALYPRFRESNPELSESEALARFMQAAKSGVEQGYGEAAKTLSALGAFEITGVQDAVEETLALIFAKLDEFEKSFNPNTEAPETETRVEGSKTSVQSALDVVA